RHVRGDGERRARRDPHPTARRGRDQESRSPDPRRHEAPLRERGRRALRRRRQAAHFYVDDGARRLVRFPQQMDVVFTMNLYGDILSDLGAETAGGLGMAPSGCYRGGWAYFESVHGAAPDIAGRGIANPTAATPSAA